MKRMLWTITAVGALAIPAGWAAAQTADDAVVEDETTTTVVCDQDQDRVQLQLHDGTGDQQRTQQRLQDHECDSCDQLQVQLREQVRVEDGQGDMVRNQYRIEGDVTPPVRNQYRVEDGQGDMVQQQTRAQVQQGETENGQDDQVGVGQRDTRRYQEQDATNSATQGAGR